MFSLAREDRIRRILGDAGFTAIRAEPVNFEFDIGRGRGLDEAAAAALTIGPAGRALEGQPPEIRRAALGSIRRALAPHQRGSAIPLAAAVWIVTAINP